MMRAQVIGSLDSESVNMPWSLKRRFRRVGWESMGALEGVGQAVSAAVTWIGENAAEVGEWLSGAGAEIAGFAQDAIDFLGIGPSYDSENGGEVYRQLEGTGQQYQKWAQSYMDWLKKYDDPRWQSGDLWEPGTGNASSWHDAYAQYIAMGMPEGFLMDANLVPQGLAAASQAILALDAAGLGAGSSGGGPRPQPGSGTDYNALWTGSGGGSGSPGNSKLLTYGAVGVGLLLLLNSGKR